MCAFVLSAGLLQLSAAPNTQMTSLETTYKLAVQQSEARQRCLSTELDKLHGDSSWRCKLGQYHIYTVQRASAAEKQSVQFYRKIAAESRARALAFKQQNAEESGALHCALAVACI